MRGAVIWKLSERLLGKEWATEIDAGDDEIKVANANSEEILVDFPSAVRREGMLVDFPSRQSSLQDVHAVTGPALGPAADLLMESEGDIDDDGFLGFPHGGRKPCARVEGRPAMLGTESEFICNSLPSTIEILMAESQHDQNRESWEERNNQHFELHPTNVGADDHEEYTDRSQSLECVDADEEAFEKPPNWVGDEESSAGDSEEQRQQIIRMNQERRASAAPGQGRRLSAASGQGRRLSAAAGQGRRLSAPSGQGRRLSAPSGQGSRNSASSENSQGGLYAKESNDHLQKRSPNKAGRQSSMPANFVPVPSTTKSPFSDGFEFAKAVPAPLMHGRRPSLANTTYTFEKEVANRPRRARRASLDNYRPTNTGYTDGLKAFGAKQHDIRHILT